MGEQTTNGNANPVGTVTAESGRLTATNHSSPSVQVLGSVVLLQREAVLMAAALLDAGIRQHTIVNGIEPNRRVLILQDAFAAAAARVRDDLAKLGRSDVQPMGRLTQSRKQVDAIGTNEAAEILGCSPRQVTRLARSLDGWGGRQGKGWLFSRAQIEAYALERRTN